jgi:hypothetical protein
VEEKQTSPSSSDHKINKFRHQETMTTPSHPTFKSNFIRFNDAVKIWHIPSLKIEDELGSNLWLNRGEMDQIMQDYAVAVSMGCPTAEKHFPQVHRFRKRLIRSTQQVVLMTQAEFETMLMPPSKRQQVIASAYSHATMDSSRRARLAATQLEAELNDSLPQHDELKKIVDNRTMIARPNSGSWQMFCTTPQLEVNAAA